jgi:hypothetical protein
MWNKDYHGGTEVWKRGIRIICAEGVNKYLFSVLPLFRVSVVIIEFFVISQIKIYNSFNALRIFMLITLRPLREKCF